MRKFLMGAALLVLMTGHSSFAQGTFGWGYNGSFGGSTTFGGNAMMITRHRYSPPARYDSTIDPTLIRAASIADGRAGRRSSLKCWRAVKTALVDAGAVKSYPATAYAYQAGSELTSRYGFVRLNIRDPYRAPIGAVIVYSGSGAGHVELRTSHGFVSDYRSSSCCRYKVTGIYAKLATKASLTASAY